MEAEGAAFGRLLEILEDEEVRLDLKALIWFSRYDMVMIKTCDMPHTSITFVHNVGPLSQECKKTSNKKTALRVQARRYIYPCEVTCASRRIKPGSSIAE